MKSEEVRKVGEGREFTDPKGDAWRVSYTKPVVRGLISMDQIVFEPLDSKASGAARYLAVHLGYLESVDDRQLEVALSQAQSVDPPW